MGSSIHPIILKSVDLLEPDGPVTAIVSPYLLKNVNNFNLKYMGNLLELSFS